MDIRHVLAANPLKASLTQQDKKFFDALTSVQPMQQPGHAIPFRFTGFKVPKFRKGACNVNESLFRYCVMWHPTEEERKQGEKSRIVVPVSDWVLAQGEKAAVMRATKEIPAEEMENADQLEVCVSPF